MQTFFTEQQLKDHGTRAANSIIRKCVHCGVCTAVCPTYQLLGDELDGPRGRIYLIKEMLENNRPADRHTVKHIDRCLSCLSCTSTCPSGVDYMHLIDHARVYIEKTYRRPWIDRVRRAFFAYLLVRPQLFRLGLIGAVLVRPFRRFLPKALRQMVNIAPRKLRAPSIVDKPQIFPARGKQKGRVILMNGCAQKALEPGINEATIRLLTRLGYEVVVPSNVRCCGALAHHMGKEAQALHEMRANLAAWIKVDASSSVDAIIINASGCGTTVKDYGHIFAEHQDLEETSRKFSAITFDISEFLASIEVAWPSRSDIPFKRVVYHAACSLQHGQKIRVQPKQLLKNAGFEVMEPENSHLCCGSAGTYNLLQPDIAAKLQANKVEALRRTGAKVVVAGNIGCIMQIAGGAPDLVVVHLVELLDWALGGPAPMAFGAQNKV